MTEIAVIDAIKSVGFPVIVAGYLLLRMERTMRGLEATLSGLRNTLAVLNQPWSGIERRRPAGSTGTRAPWREAGG